VKPWVEPAHEPFYITNATVIDPSKGELKSGTYTIRIEKGVITSVEPQSEAVLEDSLKQVDARGRYICPGLIDAHVHVCAVPGVSVSGALNTSRPQADWADDGRYDPSEQPGRHA